MLRIQVPIPVPLQQAKLSKHLEDIITIKAARHSVVILIVLDIDRFVFSKSGVARSYLPDGNRILDIKDSYDCSRIRIVYKALRW
jgi:hypothetical protein